MTKKCVIHDKEINKTLYLVIFYYIITYDKKVREDLE